MHYFPCFPPVGAGGDSIAQYNALLEAYLYLLWSLNAPPTLPGLSLRGTSSDWRRKALSTSRVSVFISSREMEETEDMEGGRSLASDIVAVESRTYGKTHEGPFN